MDIYTALKKDHLEMKTIVNELMSLNEEDDYRFVLMTEIKRLLIAHSRAEEAIFYNTLRAIDLNKQDVFHGFKEHFECESLLETLIIMDELNVAWKKTGEKFRDLLFHHLDEEEQELFSDARKMLTADENESLGEVFLEYKKKYDGEGSVQGVFDLVVNLLPSSLADRVRDMTHKGI